MKKKFFIKVFLFALALVVISCSFIQNATKDKIRYCSYVAPKFVEWRKFLNNEVYNIGCCSIDSVKLREYIRYAYMGFVPVYDFIMLNSCSISDGYTRWDKLFCVYHFHSGERIMEEYTFIFLKGDRCKIISYDYSGYVLKVTYCSSEFLSVVLDLPAIACGWEELFLVASFDSNGDFLNAWSGDDFWQRLDVMEYPYSEFIECYPWEQKRGSIKWMYDCFE